MRISRAIIAALALFALPIVSFAKEGSPTSLTPLPVAKAKANEIKTPETETTSLTGLPYGSNLFTGQFASESGSSVNENYKIQPGDKINVATWGAGDGDITLELTVDRQNKIFIPRVGPVQVGGLPQSKLNAAISARMHEYYQDSVKVYTSLQGTQAVSVFVSGGVNQPGRYGGDATDSLLHYIDRARGIDPNRGSYRVIEVLRNGTPIAHVDLYHFLMNGIIPTVQLKDNDVIFVRGLGNTVMTSGAVQNRNRFEFTSPSIRGEEIIAMTRPMPATTHAIVSGIRDGQGFSNYLSLDQLATTDIRQGDSVDFKEGTLTATLTINIAGEHLGPQVVVAPADARLKEVLRHVRIDKELADINSIFLRRESVAVRQKQALDESLRRLEQSVIAANPQNTADASMKAQEFQIVQLFIDRARQVEPEGRVVLSDSGVLQDIQLEDGDTIVIPRRSNLVMVNGEISMPKAIVYKDGESPEYYINRAGGYTERADKGNIVLARLNGETVVDSSDVHPGDEIIVMPEVQFSSLMVTQTVVDILYKVAIAIAVPLRL